MMSEWTSAAQKIDFNRLKWEIYLRRANTRGPKNSSILHIGAVTKCNRHGDRQKVAGIMRAVGQIIPAVEHDIFYANFVDA